MDLEYITLIGIIASIIAAVATAVMAFLTWKTLKQNQNQLDELKKQWNEQNEPKIIPSFIKSNGSVYLRVKNYTGTFANDVKVLISTDNNKYLDWFDELKEKLDQSLLNIEPFGYKDMMIIFTDWSETVYDGYLNVSITIDRECKKSYILNISELNVMVTDIENNKLIKAIEGITNQLQRGVPMH